MRHIRILVSIVCVCFVSLAWGQKPADTVNDWSQFHRTNMQRWNPNENVLNVNNVGGLHLKWSYPTSGPVYSSPAVANGQVYVGTNFFYNQVMGLNAITGTPLWMYTTGAWVVSSPATANGTVYVGSWDYNVYGLNGHTGAKLWNYFTSGRVFATPTVVNGVVYSGQE